MLQLDLDNLLIPASFFGVTTSSSRSASLTSISADSAVQPLDGSLTTMGNRVLWEEVWITVLTWVDTAARSSGSTTSFCTVWGARMGAPLAAPVVSVISRVLDRQANTNALVRRPFNGLPSCLQGLVG